MPNVTVYDKTGAKVSEIELSESVFGIEPSVSAMHLCVVNYLANQRQGTQSTLTRGEVSGGGKKPWRQKGSGRARQGSTRSPQWYHGGIAHGPKPRDYGFKLNKKVRQLARKSALAYKAQENAIVVVENFTFEAPKTKNFIEVIKNLKVDGKKALFVLPGTDKAVYLSARNIERVKVMAASALNTYKVLDADVLVLTEGALDIVAANLNK